MPPARRFLIVLALLWTALLAQSAAFERPEFRPWEILYDAETLRFRPSRTLEMEAVGDLGHESHVPALQVPRPVRFTTDRWGFRNPIDIERPRVVVLGDSFVVGAGLTDTDTLTVRMSRYLGEPVYNFGTQSIDGPGLFLREPRFAQAPPEVVIWAPVARRIRPRPIFFRDEAEAPVGVFARAAAATRDTAEALQRFTEALDRDNGLTRIARRTLQTLRFRFFGHEDLIETDVGPALALDVEAQGLHVPPEARDIALSVEMVTVFHRFLAEHGVRLIFAPIPESGTIYPELFPPEQRAALQHPSFLDRLLAGVAAAGVEVVDLRAVFEAHRTPYLYQRDDSHWNPRAIDLAGRALAEAAGPRLAKR